MAEMFDDEDARPRSRKRKAPGRYAVPNEDGDSGDEGLEVRGVSEKKSRKMKEPEVRTGCESLMVVRT